MSEQTAGNPSFSDFLQRLRASRPERHAQHRLAMARDAHAFDEQRQHLLDLYEGLDVRHSFVDEHGQVFDCVPIDQQPALRRSGAPLASPPAVPVPPGQAAVQASTPLHLQAARKDGFGNAMACPAGTVPIRRVTLEEVTRFETLERFLRKAPRRPAARGVAAAAVDSLRGAAAEHRYAFAAQSVANLGGQGVLNVWSPTVTGDQVFSLSQHWYVANGSQGVQTVEVGWQVYPRKYGHAKPVLFTYWTADGYRSTGSYSLDGGAFVQYSSNCPLGRAWSPVSASGGAQAEFMVTYMLSGGNWWLFLNGTDQSHAIGYYPATQYQGGPLATQASEMEAGGETAGVASFPPMGSGAFASKGAGQAAYQRNLAYFPPVGGLQTAALVPDQQYPASYTIAVDRSGEWGAYFYFGGPGGGTAG